MAKYKHDVEFITCSIMASVAACGSQKMSQNWGKEMIAINDIQN